MKKVILGVLALIFAMALVVGGYILFASRDLQKYAVEEGVSCPYSWEELRSGAYRLEIDTTAYPDHSWSVECYPKNVVAATEEESADGTIVFSILPLNMGQTYVQVSCEQTEPLTVRVFEIGMQINVSEDLKITVVSTEETEYNGIVTMGEEKDYPIQWWADAAGTIQLLIEEENSGSWEAVDYDPNSLEVVGPFYRQGSCGFEILGKQAGTFALVVYDGIDKALQLEIAVAEDLTATVTDFDASAYAVDRSEEHLALESAVGRTIRLPQQAVATKYSVMSSSGSVEFFLDNARWNWQIAADPLVGDIDDTVSEIKTDTVGDMTLTACHVKDGAVAFWMENDCTMLLYGELDSSADDALAVARQIVEENHGQ